MTKQERIAAERQEFGLKPWEMAPSEVDDRPSPWPLGTGYDSWIKAQGSRRELLARDPDYFKRSGWRFQ